MTEWDLMIKIAKANNTGDGETLAALISEHDFAGKERATTLALSGFAITKDNVRRHQSAAKKLVSLPAPKAMREALRQELLKGLIERITITVTILVEHINRYVAIDGNGVGGNLYMVLSNKNISNDHISFCLNQAQEKNDMAGVKLANLLLLASKTQRLKACHKWH
jgi:hypothetical protein